MKIFLIYPKDSEALFDKKSLRTFGGASVQMYNIAKELSNYSEINTYSIIPEYNSINFDDFEKFNLLMAYKEDDNAIVKLLKFLKLLLKIKPDVIIQRGLTTESCILSFICWILRIKFVFMFAHDVEANGLRQKDQSRVMLFCLLRKFSYVIVAQNKYQHDTFLHKYNGKSKIIYNGFEIKKIKERNKDKNKKTYILWVARCDEWKQPEIFIQLAKQNPKLQFSMICPKSQDEIFFNKIKSQALTVKNLLFLDFVPYDKINEYFKYSILFVNTSLYEGFPQTFIQATMNGIPIITLYVNPEEFLNVHQCGFCCNGNIELLDEKIKELINNRKKYGIFSKNAFKYALENHDISVTVKNLLNLLS